MACITLVGFAQVAQPLPAWAFGPFERPAGVNPILSPKANSTFLDPMSNKVVAWEANDVFNPAAAVMNNKIYVLYRAEDKSGVGIGERTSRLGLASSSNGISMQRRSAPVMFPGNDSQKQFEWPGGCEDPRVAVTEDGTYVMMYTQWNKKVPRIGVATSKNLINWTKHGPAFYHAYQGKYRDMATKSASLITKLVNGRQVIAKINGRYWMYWGERFINPATSTDLIHWQPMQDARGDLLQIVKTRELFFDSDLTECGPPAIVTKDGILLLYNGKNKAGEGRDENYTANTYSAGQVLFDVKDPTKVIGRLDKPFLCQRRRLKRAANIPQELYF